MHKPHLTVGQLSNYLVYLGVMIGAKKSPIKTFLVILVKLIADLQTKYFCLHRINIGIIMKHKL